MVAFERDTSVFDKLKLNIQGDLVKIALIQQNETFILNEAYTYDEENKVQTRSYFTGNCLYHPAYREYAEKYGNDYGDPSDDDSGDDGGDAGDDGDDADDDDYGCDDGADRDE